jgi:uncharacterized membrane protein YciS (DUF1049 family)
MSALIDVIVSYLVAYEQLLVTVLLGILTALSVLYTILYYTKQEIKRKIENKKKQKISEVRINKSVETTTDQHDVIVKPISVNSSGEKQIVTVGTPTTKTIQSEYNLEHFMIRLYKNGVAVTRLKEGMEKSRGISLNRLGQICMHKVSSSSTWKPTTGSPFVRFPLEKLIGCFHAEGTSMPSFIMDFKVKTWHLAVGSWYEVNFIVIGFKLMAEKLRTDKDEFMSSVVTLLSKQTSSQSQHSSSNMSSKREHKVLTASPPSRKGSTSTAAALLFPQTSGNDDDDDDALSVSTINTNAHNH